MGNGRGAGGLLPCNNSLCPATNAVGNAKNGVRLRITCKERIVPTFGCNGAIGVKVYIRSATAARQYEWYALYCTQWMESE